MDVQNNRIYAKLTLQGPNGIPKILRCWLDSGGGSLVLNERTAATLGYSLEPAQAAKDYVPIELPKVFLDTTGVGVHPATKCYIQPGAAGYDLMAGSDAFVPLSAFRGYSCRIDYRQERFELNPTSVLGTRLPISISQGFGFPRIEVTVDRDSYGFLLDTGAACTMLSRSVIDRLSMRHSGWQRIEGSYGPANMIGGRFDTENVMLRIPEIRLAGVLPVNDVVVVSRRTGIFEQNMAKFVTAPIVGAIAGDVLSRFTLTLDYPNELAILEPNGASVAKEYAMVPISLSASPDGPTVDNIVPDADSSLKAGLLRGDRLTAVDGTALEGIPLQKVFEMLQGTPGATTHVLSVRRADQDLVLRVSVRQII